MIYTFVTCLIKVERTFYLITKFSFIVDSQQIWSLIPSKPNLKSIL